MKIIYFLFRIFYFVIFTIIIISCNRDEHKDDAEKKQENKFKDQELSIIDDADLLRQIYNEKIIDFYDDGSPLTVEYYNKDNPAELVFERKYYRSGNLFMEGPVEDGKRHGKWIAWFENGNIWSVANYVAGMNHGLSKVYYENKQLRYSKEHDMGAPDGLWKFYCPQGNLLGEIMYKQGEIEWEKNYMDKLMD